jgi:hypothetical protein
MAQIVRIEEDRDATLVEYPDGALVNGSGPFVFATSLVDVLRELCEAWLPKLLADHN